MKKPSFVKYGAVVLLVAGLVAFAAPSAWGQNADTTGTTANANIIAGISLFNTEGQGLVFGDLTVSATLSGTATVDPADNRTVTGGVSEAGGTPAAAAFNVTGETSHSYTITLPSNTDVKLTGVGDDMAVTNFTSSSGLSHTLSGGTPGTDAFTVGATLAVSAGQAPDLYTGTFDVIVSYP